MFDVEIDLVVDVAVAVVAVDLELAVAVDGPICVRMYAERQYSAAFCIAVGLLR